MNPTITVPPGWRVVDDFERLSVHVYGPPDARHVMGPCITFRASTMAKAQQNAADWLERHS